MPTEPMSPSFPRHVIAACLPGEDERHVLHDLEALYTRRVAEQGALQARLWYARQAASFVLRVGLTRLGGFLGGGDGLRAEVRSSVRSLARRPTFALAFVFTLAVGIGVLSTVYAAARWVLLRPVPNVTAPEAVVVMRLVLPGAPPHISFPVSELDLEMLRDRLPVEHALAGLSRIDVDVSADGSASRRVTGEMVSANYFAVLGTPLAAGRTFLSGEDHEALDGPVAILSTELARALVGDNRPVVGLNVRINGALVRIIGVAPAGFGGAEIPGQAQIWMPLSALTVIDPSARPRAAMDRASGVWSKVIARPLRGITAPALEREAAGIIKIVRKEFRGSSYMAPVQYQVVPGLGLDPGVRESVSRTLALLGSAAALLLLLAIANLTNLTLVRATLTGTVTAIRFALGASRVRIARMVLTDALVLGVTGGLAALVVAEFWSRWYQSTVLNEHGGALTGMHVDARGVLVTIGAALMATVIAFLKPAFDTRYTSLRSRLRGGNTGAPTQRLRMTLVAAQVAVTVVLLVAAGLLGRTVSNLRNIGLGFEPDRILTFAMDPHLHGFEAGRLDDLARTLDDRLSRVPGARAAGLISPSPLRSGYLTASLTRPGAAPGSKDPADQPIGVAGYYVSPGFLGAIGARVIAGEQGWNADSGSMVLTRSAVARLFPGEDPRLAVGRTVPRRANRDASARIAAVIEDLRLSDIARDPPPSIFMPLANRYPGMSVTVFVAAQGSPLGLVRAVREVTSATMAEIPLYDVRSARTAVDQQFAERDAMSQAASTLGLVALLLAAVGLYGVLANITAARRKEFGIRLAMGASPRRIVGIVIADGFVPVAIGLAVGVAGAMTVSKALSSQLFAIERFDPASYAIALLTLIGAAAVACAIPAYRACLVPPAEVLRTE